MFHFGILLLPTVFFICCPYWLKAWPLIICCGDVVFFLIESACQARLSFQEAELSEFELSLGLLFSRSLSLDRLKPVQTYSSSDDTGNVNAVNMTNVNLLEETFRQSLCLQSNEDDKDYIFCCVMSSVLTEPIKLVIFFLTGYYIKYWCMAYCVIHSIYSLIPSEYVKHDLWKDIYKIR